MPQSRRCPSPLFHWEETPQWRVCNKVNVNAIHFRFGFRICLPVCEVGGRVVSVVDIGTVSIWGEFDNLRVRSNAFFAVIQDTNVEQRSSISTTAVTNQHFRRTEWPQIEVGGQPCGRLVDELIVIRYIFAQTWKNNLQEGSLDYLNLAWFHEIFLPWYRWLGPDKRSVSSWPPDCIHPEAVDLCPEVRRRQNNRRHFLPRILPWFHCFCVFTSYFQWPRDLLSVTGRPASYCLFWFFTSFFHSVPLLTDSCQLIWIGAGSHFYLLWLVILLISICYSMSHSVRVCVSQLIVAWILHTFSVDWWMLYTCVVCCPLSFCTVIFVTTYSI